MSDPTPENVTTAAEPVKTEKTFTQAELDAAIKDRLERERRKAAEQAEKARAEAEAKALAEQGEYKTLAEQRAAEVAKLAADLEASKQTTKALERYQAAVAAMVAPQVASLPEPLQARIKALDALEQLEWLTALGAQQPAQSGAPTLAATNPPAQRGQPARPAGGWTLSDIYKR